MATSILQIVLGLIGIMATLLAWWIKNDADKKKRISDEDAKIEAVSNADDTIVELDRLRNEPPTNRP
jgi:hypothetical protein